jgi:phosphate-selective porin OprO/OprP
MDRYAARTFLLVSLLFSTAIHAEDAQPANLITVTADPSSGLSFYNSDKTYGLKFSGVLQADGRFYLNDVAKPQQDTFLPRRGRFQLDAQLGSKAKLRLQEDFVTGLMVDAYGELKPLSFVTLRLGLFKTPLSLERWRSDPSRDFVEMGYTTSLVTDRDTGAWLELADPDQAILFGAGVFNGSADTIGTITSDSNDPKDAVAKIFLHPFRFFGVTSLRDVGFGIAGSYGDHSGSVLSSVKSLGQAAVLSYTATVSNLDGYGAGGRLAPQAYLFWNSLSFLGEYVDSWQGAYASGNTGPNDMKDYIIHNAAWQVQAGWVITGENASFNGLKLNKEASSAWGALQVVGRYQAANFDPEAFTTYANNQGTLTWSKRFMDPRDSVSGIRSWSVGLNYVPVNNVKLLVDFDQSLYTDGTSSGVGANTITANRETENVILARAQFSY